MIVKTVLLDSVSIRRNMFKVDKGDDTRHKRIVQRRRSAQLLQFSIQFTVN